MSNDKPSAVWHPGTGPTPRGAADVLREHALKVITSFLVKCECGDTRRSEVGEERWEWHRQHQADMLAAAGLLVDPRHSCQETFLTENAVAIQAQAEHDAQVAAQELRDAAEAINYRDAETIRREAGADVVSGPTRALDVIRWLRARADRIAGGAA